MSEVDRKAKAEARRARLLARGSDRLMSITTSVAGPLPEMKPEGLPGPAVAPMSLVPAAPSPVTSTAAPEAGATVAHPTALRRKVGAAAADAKWSDYQAAAAAAPTRLAARKPPPSATDALVHAVRTTAPMRLLMGAVLALLISVAGDVQAGKNSVAAPPRGPWSQLKASWQQPVAAQPEEPPRSVAASPMEHGAAWLRGLPAAACSQLEAAVESPVVAAALPHLQRLPPLATLVVLNALLIAAAFVAIASTGTARRPQAPQSLIARLAPGIAARLSLLGAAYTALSGLADDAAMYLFVLVLYHVLPQAASSWFA